WTPWSCGDRGEPGGYAGGGGGPSRERAGERGICREPPALVERTVGNTERIPRIFGRGRPTATPAKLPAGFGFSEPGIPTGERLRARPMGELLDIVSLGPDDEALVDGIGVRRSTHDSRRRVPRHAHDFHGVTLILSSPGHVEWHFGEGQAYSGR